MLPEEAGKLELGHFGFQQFGRVILKRGPFQAKSTGPQAAFASFYIHMRSFWMIRAPQRERNVMVVSTSRQMIASVPSLLTTMPFDSCERIKRRVRDHVTFGAGNVSPPAPRLSGGQPQPWESELPAFLFERLLLLAPLEAMV